MISTSRPSSGATAVLAAVLALGLSASATAFTDDFNRPNGTSLGPDWTEVAGDWRIEGNRARNAAGSTPDVMTYGRGAVSPTLSADVYYLGGIHVVYAALVSGYADLNNCVFVKVQDQDQNGTFNRLYFYYGNNGGGWSGMTGGSSSTPITPFTQGRLTTRVAGATVTAEIDRDFDGVPEEIHTRGNLPTAGLGTGVGLGGYNNAALDNFQLRTVPIVPVRPEPRDNEHDVATDALLSWNRQRGGCVVVPTGNETVEGNSNNSFPFDIVSFYSTLRYQQIYAASAVSRTGTITEIRFRNDTAQSAFSPTGMRVAVYLGYSATSVTAPSTTFANNIGPGRTLVYDGNLTISSYSQSGPPRDFDIVIDVEDRFDYDPSAGPLLLDIYMQTTSDTEPFDAQSSTGNQTARIYSGNVTNAAGSATTDYGLVTLFCFDGAAPAIGPGDETLLIETGSDIEDTLGQMLDDLAVPYDFMATSTFTNLDLSPYGTIVIGANGGLMQEADMLHLARAAHLGARVLLLGGSNWDPFVAGLNEHFVRIDTNNHAWVMNTSPPDLGVAYPAHWLAAGLAASNDLVTSEATYYMARIIDTNVTTVVTNGDGHPALVQKPMGAGEFTFFINVPAPQSFWNDPGDYALLETILHNALSGGVRYDVSFSAGPAPLTPLASGLPVPVCDPSPGSDLAGGVEHTWRVTATDASGSAPGPVWSFTTEPRSVPIYSFAFDKSPSWYTDGQWAFGQPQGMGSHNGDPTSGHTGLNVYGYNLSGDYTNNMASAEYLTTRALDCRAFENVTLSFWRWLGVEESQYDYATIDVSNNGSTWSNVWQNPGSVSGYPCISDAAWSNVTYDISAVADGQQTVYVRWGMGPTDSSVTYPGWNLDDVVISGAPIPSTPCDPRPADQATHVPPETLLTWNNGPAAVVPNACEWREGDSGNYFPFDNSAFGMSGQRYQQIYAPEELGNGGTVTEIRFRPDGGVGNPFDTNVTVAIYLGYAATTVLDPTNTFADNIGAGRTMVYNGVLPVASADTGGPPRNFDVVVDVADAFDYDPGCGPLLLDIYMYSDSDTCPFDTDGSHSSQTGVTRIYGDPVGATSGTVHYNGPLTAPHGLVTRIRFRPSVLVYDDYRAQGAFAQDALDHLGIAYHDVGASETAFRDNLATSTWDLVVCDAYYFYLLSSTLNSISNYIAGGGRMMMFYFDMDGEAAFTSNFEAQVKSTFWDAKPVFDVGDSAQIWTYPNALPPALTDADDYLFSDDGDTLQPIGGGRILASFTPGGGTTSNEAMILGNAGRTILHGFSPDGVGFLDGDLNGKVDRVELYENEILFLLADDPGTSYDVYFDTNQPPAQLLLAGAPRPCCDPTPLPGHRLDSNRTYYWSVVARNPVGSSTGPVWRFTTSQHPFESFAFHADPGWTCEGDWEYGVPQGMGSHSGDPGEAHSGTYVYGYNLSGDYTNNMPAVRYLTTPALDCRAFENVTLSFWRWLGVENVVFDQASVEVSNDGAAWSNVWANGASMSDTAWTLQTFDISAVADGQQTVYVRWGMGPTDSSVTYPGWNLDDVSLCGDPLYACMGTPVWWLILHGLTNDTWCAEELKDVDGDGVCAYLEERCGTNPRDGNDVFCITDIGAVTNRHPISFTTVAGKSYYVWGSTDLTDTNAWTGVPYAMGPLGPMYAPLTPVPGTDGIVTVFVQPASVPHHYRATVE